MLGSEWNRLRQRLVRGLEGDQSDSSYRLKKELM